MKGEIKMKATKLTINFTLFAVFMIFSLIFIGCSENDNLLNPAGSNESYMDNSGGVIVEAQYTPGNPGYYSFWIRNNMTDTIVNDFHVQLDSSFTILRYTPRTGWITDSQTTDTSKGKVGVRCYQQGREFRPGEHGYPLSNVQLASTHLRNSMNFNWQATRNGVVVAQGTGTLP